MNGTRALTLWQYYRYPPPKLCTIKRSSTRLFSQYENPQIRTPRKQRIASLERRAEHPQQDAAVDGMAGDAIGTSQYEGVIFLHRYRVAPIAAEHDPAQTLKVTPVSTAKRPTNAMGTVTGNN